MKMLLLQMVMMVRERISTRSAYLHRCLGAIEGHTYSGRQAWNDVPDDLGGLLGVCI